MSRRQSLYALLCTTIAALILAGCAPSAPSGDGGDAGDTAGTAGDSGGAAAAPAVDLGPVDDSKVWVNVPETDPRRADVPPLADLTPDQAQKLHAAVSQRIGLQTDLDFKTAGLPNLMACEGEITDVTIHGADGKLADGKFDSNWMTNSDQFADDLLRFTGVEASKVTEVRGTFELVVPTTVRVFSFKAGDAAGSQQSQDGVTVTLKQCEGKVAEVSVTNNQMQVAMRGYDAAGQRLNCEQCSWHGSGAKGQFSGEVASILVVTAPSVTTISKPLSVKP